MPVNEIQKLALELLELMEGMPPEQIEELLKEWEENHIGKEPEKWERVKDFVESVSNMAISRNLKNSLIIPGVCI